MTRQKIVNLIEKAIKQSPFDKELEKFGILEILVETQQNPKFGNYSSNVALRISKIIKKNPMEIASILWGVGHPTDSFLEKVEIKQPGFINFFLSKKYLQKQVADILKQKEKFGELKIGKNQKTQVEFIDGNPTGALHIGHGRGAFFGDCLSNVLAKAGYKVEREYYVNNAQNSNQIKELGKTGMGQGTVYLTKDLKKIIREQKSKIKKFNSEAQAGYFLAQIIHKTNKDFIEKKLKIKFDNWIFEQDLYEQNKIEKVYNLLKKKNLIYESEDAQWLKTTKYGDQKDWVIKRSTGEPTYFLADIAYHKDKFDKRFKKIINIWGADHQAHLSKMKAAAKILGYKGDFDILICQVVRLKSGLKLSKRKGQIITLEELIDEVGLDVVRFFYLSKSLDTQMEFDIDLAKEQSQKNPVYYIQYAYARIHSILRKAKNTNHLSLINYKLLKHPSELNLIKQIIKFPEMIEDAAKDYQVQRIPKYAVDLATAFHQFYRDCQVITDDKNLTEARIGLISATKITLKNTLDLMGISAPEKM